MTTTHVAQRRIAIQAVVLIPIDVGAELDSVSVTIITHAPERVQRFKDGSTISNMGISRITHYMKPSPENPFEHRLPIPTDEEARLESNWFVQDGIGYLSAEVGDHVAVHVHRGKEDGETLGVILYRVLERTPHG